MSKRPLRNFVEKQTDKIPRGPLGIAGKGNLIGLTGYFTVSAANAVVPLEGVDIGFSIESHNVSRSGNIENHDFVIHSTSKDIAEAIARFKSTPTMLNSARDKVEVESVELEEERAAFSRWRVSTVVTKRDV